MVDNNDVRQAGAEARSAGRAVEQSKPYRWLVRVGLICYGVVHVLVAWLALQLVIGGSSEDDPSLSGALRNLSDQPFGQVLVLVTAVGFATLTLWQLLQALFGHREFDGLKRIRKRVSSAGKTVLYGFLCFSAARLAVGSSSGGGEGTELLTARVLDIPFGRLLVVLLAAVIVAVGVALIVKGLRQKFTEEMVGGSGTLARALGTAGYVTKGISIILIGMSFALAAYHFDPDQAGGTDDAFRTLLSQPWGIVALVVVSVGLAKFGLYCFYWSRHVKLSNA